MNSNIFENNCCDIVICIDAMERLVDVIENVKSRAISFIQQFIDSVEYRWRMLRQVRVKIIAFRDFSDTESEPMQISRFFLFPDEQSELISFIKNIIPKGKGSRSNALEAIALALKSDWTTGGTGRRHVIVVFTDAPALPLGERSGSSNYPSGMPKDLTQLRAWWEGTDWSFESTYQWKAGRLVIFAPDTEPWNVMSTWNRVTFFPSKAGEGMDDEIGCFIRGGA